MKNWLLAIRPKTLFASLAPVLLGLATAYVEAEKLNLVVALLTILCALALQIASNLANDYLDALKGVDNDTRLGPTRVTSTGLIAPTAMRNALIFSLIISFLLGIYLMIVGGPVIMVIGLLALYFAYGYTGGPFPLSYKGLGEVSAFVFFGVVAVFGTHFLQTHTFSWISVLAGMGPGFISACILAVNNLRDIKSDSECNKRTLAVRFGEKFQRILCLLMIFFSMVVLIVFIFMYGYKTLYPILILPFFFHKTWLQIMYGQIDKNLNNALARTAQYNLLYCLFFSLALVFSSRWT